ncbi:aminotransferase class I/II-fold pyridoxal phosphate-dependent enzyme [Metabacillus sediminilitoris]|uniref:Aminotransferase class I/II-fold pyridoxal phosphate-dependent enzyme n=1 Tax=Metabacillus sediminilitoris TaxID=2567941 RepID=A0A4S4C1N4_9BACI|nr:aminotransferase class I/II-fold pyridoxal phosphate-dependent enzyme [Metabacillus sediminilitoris]QGQ48078.1 aminotransferase class I/II-fold pyridoxal phosphate-dependent enzyme [Metabacillus sediminilitoris]THF81560.1 aminotransferase class I/II-fold pyridoxal phosphate-dependent enzyme [Metabacillus sediminilitoris]
MNQLAQTLNQAVKEDNEHVYDMLSQLGKEMFYPKGILSQSAEAGKKAHRFNATIGIATEESQPMHFQHIQDLFGDKVAPKDLFPYAPPQGKEDLRKVWKEKILKDNPSLDAESVGTPVVTNALTHGLSIVADLFVDEGTPVILPDKYWGNYNITFSVRRGGIVKTYPLFNEANGFNVAGLKESIQAQKEAGKVVVLLNFPNNPTGYTPLESEAKEIVAVLKEAADEGLNVIALIDDAYFGLFYEDSMKESIFSLLADVHPRILPIKVDGATKENYVWGFRVGFITYASKSAAILNALEQKTKGIIRGTISSASHPSQSIILQSLQSEEFPVEKEQKFALMKSRADKTKEVLAKEEYQKYWTYYPFNSGYFMCLKLHTINAEELRLHLLDKYGVGTISINDTDLRIAFSCVEAEDIEELFDLIAQGAADLQ